MFEKGAQEILNLTLKNASVSLISTLKATAIETVIIVFHYRLPYQALANLLIGYFVDFNY